MVGIGMGGSEGCCTACKRGIRSPLWERKKLSSPTEGGRPLFCLAPSSLARLSEDITSIRQQRLSAPVGCGLDPENREAAFRITRATNSQCPPLRSEEHTSELQ